MSFYGNQLIDFSSLKVNIEQSTEQPESGSSAKVKYTCKFNNGEISTFTVTDGWQLANVETTTDGKLKFTFLNSTGTVVVDSIPLSNLIGFKTNYYFDISLTNGKIIEITPTTDFIKDLCHVEVSGEKLIFEPVKIKED